MIASTTPAEFTAEAAQHEADAHESFERCDTDGFLTQWASGINAQVARANAEIAANDGMATFWTYKVISVATGKTVNFRRANTRYGFKLVVDMPDGEVWIDPNAREATNTSKGVSVGREEFTLPAHANTWAPPGARGMSGASSVTVRIFPDDRDVKWDGVTR